MRHLLHFVLLFGLPALTLAVALIASSKPHSTRARTDGADPWAAAVGFRVPARRPREGAVRAEDTQRSPRSAAGRLVVAVAICTAAAGVVHAAVTPEHFGEFWLFGVFFLGAAIGQLAWSAGMAAWPSRLLLEIGVAGNAAVIVLWILTRTVGIPVGPEAGATERTGLLDVTATLYEAAAVGLGVWLLRYGRKENFPRRVVCGVDALAALVVLVPTLVLGLIAHK